MRISLIIAAGGSGSRFKRGLARAGARPGAGAPPATKLFYPLAGKPLIFRTLDQFSRIPQIAEIVIALPPGLKRSMRAWGRRAGRKPLICVSGGRTRAESVAKALRHTSKRRAWIMVHDGARPLIDCRAVQTLISKASRPAAPPALLLAKKVVPTIKKAAPGRLRVEQTLDREALYEAETPQLFRRHALQNAYRKLSGNLKNWIPTDEAALLEKAGFAAELVPHDSWNPKITTVADLELAEAFLNRSEAQLPFRMGLGSDTHRLIAGRPFRLGGVLLPADYGPLGHSDGDALIHALIDAFLGALALGDIGDFFSDRSPKHKDRPSTEMLRQVLLKTSKLGWQPAQADTVVHLERPRLGAFKKKIRAHLARLLSLPEALVSVKAKTFEGVGTGGAGLLLRCEALVMMRKKVR